MSKKKPLPLLEGVTITDIAAEGNALARVNDMVVFVPWAVPGDVVDVQVVKKKHSYCEARIVNFVKKSPLRIEPRCAHFGTCGGCKWQNLPYSEQLKAKQKQVTDQLQRIAKVELPEVNPILGSKEIWEYRNKLEFGAASKRWYTKEELQQLPPREEGKPGALTEGALGFHIPGAFDKIYPIEKCWLMPDLQNRIRNFIATYAKSIGMSFYNVREQTGVLRNIMIRHSNSGDWMLLVQFRIESADDERLAMQLMQRVADEFGEITSLFYVNNLKGNDTFNDLELHLFKGRPYMISTMEDLQFKVGPKSFYQTNTLQACTLYNVAREFAQLTGNELVYDLYTGTGTIANFVARRASKVIGIEYVPEAIEDAKENSKLNHIDNTLFYAGDMKDILTDDFIARHGRPDVIITDPPRAGMHPDVVKVIMNAAPKRIVYVSCNPATQARDLALLDPLYRVLKVQPVDMFPHTSHVENVVLLQKRNEPKN